jgi:molybdopterin molybdotransferase
MDKKYLKVKKRNDVEKILIEKFNIKTKTISLSIFDALGYFSATDYFAPFSIPSFRKSLVDGFAVRSKDVLGASPANPIPLKIVAKLKIGMEYGGKLQPGEAVYVPTGGVVPSGADSVVMIEFTQIHNDEVFIYKDVSNGENLLEIGDDIKANAQILKKGEEITPQKIALLRAFGIKKLSLFDKMPIGIISTGDELVDSGELKSGKIYDINGYALYAECKKTFLNPRFYGIVSDNKTQIKQTLEKAIAENEIVLLSGGTSKGSFDFTVNTINEIGKPGVLIHGLHLSPGKPTVFGIVNKKLVVGLSGNPLASFLTFKYVVLSLIRKKLGFIAHEHYTLAELTANVPSRKGREEFIIVKLSERHKKFFATPLFSESAFVSPFIEGSGIITVPLMSEGLLKGKKVKVQLW